MSSCQDEVAHLKALEAEYLAKLQYWDEHNKTTGDWCDRTDKYERRALGEIPRQRKSHDAKARINRAIASLASAAVQKVQGPRQDATALILDGLEAATASALVAEGFHPHRILVPNIVPSVAEALRCKGFRAWAGRIEEYLMSVELARPFDLVYLDHTGAFPRRAGQVRALFERGLVGPGSVVAFTFSTREGPWQDGDTGAVPLPKGWSRAHAVYALVRVLLDSARKKGFELQGSDLDGFVDYTCRGPSSIQQVMFDGKRPILTQIGCPSKVVTDMPSETVILRRIQTTLAEGDIAGLAQALATWSTQEMSLPEGTRCGKLRFLARKADLVTRRLLPALGDSGEACVLGAAWSVPSIPLRGSVLNRGKPCAVLGAMGQVLDEDVLVLRSAAVRVLEFFGLPQANFHEDLDDIAVGGDDDVPEMVTFKRSLLLYPEQMMFILLRVQEEAAAM